MIEEITIRNLGVIASAHLDLHAGMTALTGETGAGKTMALTSLHLLMGGKADNSKIRSGAESAYVEGIFRVDADSPAVQIVENAGGEVEKIAGEVAIIVARKLMRAGRSRAYAGGVAVPATLLQALAQELFTVHGQADQLRLVKPAQHLYALDKYAGVAEMEEFQHYQEAWNEYTELKKELTQAQAASKDIGAEKIALEALLQRINRVDPQIGEEDALRQEALRLQNTETLRTAIENARQLLNGFSEQIGALELLDKAAGELHSSQDEELDKLGDILQDNSAASAEVVNQLAEILSSLQADPQYLDEIHARRAELRALQQELSMGISEILERKTKAEDRLATLENPQQYISQLEAQVTAQRQLVEKYGAEISQRRAEKAQELSSGVTAELHALAMKDTEFIAEVESAPFSANGCDKVEFFLRPHTGAELGKLAQTASGGELSRIMLALEVILAAGEELPEHTFIFDEIDAGIGGKTALSIGKRLAQLAKKSQVLVVTHLAQVAAFASNQIVVEKEDTAAGTTAVKEVAAEEREKELARMLSGHEDSPVARTHAAELLASAIMAI